MASFDAKMKECTKPHSLAHSVSGLGIGLILVALIPALVANALVLGLIALVGGIVWDMMVNKG